MHHKGILLATNNPDKRDELEQALRQSRVRVLLPEEVGKDFPRPEETGSTYEENARIKARAFSVWSGLLALADDSGLEVTALQGKPGIHSADFAGAAAGSAANNRKLLDALRSVPEASRRARFVCVLVLCLGEQVLLTVRETCRGRIALEESMQGGFGYDPLFIPEGESVTFAAMSREEKNRISHRGKALRSFARALASGSLPMELGEINQ